MCFTYMCVCVYNIHIYLYVCVYKYIYIFIIYVSYDLKIVGSKHHTLRTSKRTAVQLQSIRHEIHVSSAASHHAVSWLKVRTCFFPTLMYTHWCFATVSACTVLPQSLIKDPILLAFEGRVMS